MASPHEYMIRGSREPGGGLGVHVTRLLDVLPPRGWTWEPAEGVGDLCLVVGGANVVLSWEDPGWHVAIDAVLGAEEAGRVVDAVAAQLTEHTGQPTTVVHLPDDGRPVRYM